ncbi:alpha/beta fold hydrolase [Nannocystaceae bacterium ST9]
MSEVEVESAGPTPLEPARELPEDRSRLLPLAPGRLWVQDLGPESASEPSEPTLLALHSILLTGWDFRFIADPLALAGRRVLAPDLFGCGNSDRPAPADAAGYGFEWHAELLVSMLDKLGITEIDLLGHGYGGAVAIHLARLLARPRASCRVRRLIVVAPYCLAVEAPIALPGPMPRLRRAWRWVGFSPLVFRTAFRRADLRRFLRRSLSTEDLLERPEFADDVDVYWDRLCRDGGLEAVEAMLAALDALHDEVPDGVRERLHDAMASLEVPTMVIWGDRDAIVPTPLAEATAALFPDAELRIIEGCGHAPQRERPQALLRALDSFDRRMR